MNILLRKSCTCRSLSKSPSTLQYMIHRFVEFAKGASPLASMTDCYAHSNALLVHAMKPYMTFFIVVTHIHSFPVRNSDIASILIPLVICILEDHNPLCPSCFPLANSLAMSLNLVTCIHIRNRYQRLVQGYDHYTQGGEPVRLPGGILFCFL